MYSCTHWLRPRNSTHSPRIWTHIRGRYWSAKIDDICLEPPDLSFLNARDAASKIPICWAFLGVKIKHDGNTEKERVVKSSLHETSTDQLGNRAVVWGQGVTKKWRLSWLTNSALVYEPKCGGRGSCGVSANKYSCTKEPK